MLNKLYLTPLHGVRCGDFSSSTHTSSLPFAVNVQEGEVNIPQNLDPIWSLVDRGERYSTELHLYSLTDNTHILDVKCEGSGKFLISEKSITIDWDEGGTDSSHYFQTSALALWLELNNIPCIHANALEYKGKCIALIGPSGMGKSTLSAYLQKQGFTWITDDMLALHGLQAGQKCKVYPSWPQARMWPDSVSNTLDQNTNDMQKVHERFNKLQVTLPENSNHEGIELSGIYMLNRQGADLVALNKNNSLKLIDASSNANKTHMAKINTSMALLSLLQNSMLGNAYSSLKLEQKRLQHFTQLLSYIQIKQINYASNYDSLADVFELITKDLFA